MTTTPENTRPEPMPVTIDGKAYGLPGHVHIDSIYASGYGGGMLYLYDPENPPYEIERGLTSNTTLSLSTVQAERLRDQLNDYLSRQK
jgi:hypothetical protein